MVIEIYAFLVSHNYVYIHVPTLFSSIEKLGSNITPESRKAGRKEVESYVNLPFME